MVFKLPHHNVATAWEQESLAQHEARCLYLRIQDSRRRWHQTQDPVLANAEWKLRYSSASPRSFRADSFAISHISQLKTIPPPQYLAPPPRQRHVQKLSRQFLHKA